MHISTTIVHFVNIKAALIKRKRPSGMKKTIMNPGIPPLAKLFQKTLSFRRG